VNRGTQRAPMGTARVEHRSLGPIVFDSVGADGRRRLGRLERSDKVVNAVPVETAPPTRVLDRLEMVDHPGLVEWLGLFRIDSGLVAITTVAEGGSLLDRATQRRLSEPEIAKVAVSINSCLDALGALGLSHGDVTPANIVLNADGQPMLTDLHDCVIADGTPLERATPGFEGTLGNASARNDRSALGQVIEFLGDQHRPWSSAELSEAVELLIKGRPLTENVLASLHASAAERLEAVGLDPANTPTVDMITRPFGPAPERVVEQVSDQRARRTLVAAALLCAALTGAVILSEQQSNCDGTACAAQCC
jgi:hypothetical protein